MRRVLLTLVTVLLFTNSAFAGRWCSVISSAAAVEKERRRPVASMLSAMKAPVPDKCVGPECQDPLILTPEPIVNRRIFRR